MPPRRETLPIPGCDLLIQITDDDSRTLIYPGATVSYHSGSGAAAETRHVYLRNSGVAERLEQGRATSVLEIGLGTGLGMLMTVDAAITTGTPLSYESVECRVLGRDVLSQLHLERSLHCQALAPAFLDWLDSLGPTVLPGRYQWRPQPEQSVWLACADALQWAQTSAERIEPDRYDAIYFDPFAPSENPALWQTEFLKAMRGVLRADGRLVTYCVNRQVRDNFSAAGFDVRRVPGPPGGKREVMIATPKANLRD